MIAPARTRPAAVVTLWGTVTAFTVSSSPRGFNVRFNDRFQTHRYVTVSQP
jgi:hypothetical protein